MMRPFLGSLNKTMVAFLALILGASSAVTTLFCAHLERTETMQAATDRVRSFSDTVKANMCLAMEEGRCGQMHELIGVLASPKEFIVVRITDTSGRIIKSTKLHEEGQFLSASAIPHIREDAVILNDPGRREQTFTTLVSFRNEPNCRRCHADRSEILGYLNADLSLDVIEAQLRLHTYSQIVSAIIVLLMMCSAMFAFFSRFVSKRVCALAREMSKVETGNLDVRVEVNNRDELGRLADSFNAMVQNLRDTKLREEDQQKILRSMNEDLRTRIDEVSTLYQASRAVSRSLRMEEILRVTLENVTRNLGFDRVVLTVFDETREVLMGKWAIGIDEEIVRQVSVPREEIKGILHETMVRKAPILVQDTAEYPIIDQAGRRRCWQVMNCGNVDCPVFSNHELRCWMTTGTLCQKEMREFTFEEKMRVCGKCSYFNEEIIRRSDVVNVLLFGSHAFISVPLTARETVLGILLADKLYSKRKEITNEDIRSLMTFMAHVSMAIENADLYHMLEQKVDMSQRQLQLANEHLRDKVEELSRIRSFNESILQNLSGVIVTYTMDGAITFINRSGAQLLGWDESELLGRSIYEVLCGDEGTTCVFQKGMEENGLFAGEADIPRRTRSRLPVEIFISPLRDEDGNVTGMTGLFRDISEKREIEARMRRMDKMASIGQLASSIAHEIKNPLAGIGSAIQVLSTSLHLDEEKTEVVREILKQINRLDKSIKSMLEFARPTPPRPILTEVNEIVQAVIFLVSQQMKTQNIAVRLVIAEGLPRARLDPLQIQQALLNVVLNAIEAMPSGGHLTIAVHETEGKMLAKKKLPHIGITVCDTGGGIPEKVISQIFNPFYTTKPSGTGLGLSITQWIVEQHNGTIDVHSNSGQGTCFMIELPI